MKKHILTILCTFLMIAVLSVAAVAAPPRMVDDADLLSDAEEAALTERLDTISETYQIDVVVVTVPSTDGAEMRAYARNYYDNNGYKPDGTLLLISMEERDWWISGYGKAEAMFPTDTCESIGSLMIDDLSMGDYAAAFYTFADECEYIIDGELNGYPFPFFTILVIALVVGFVAALIAVSVMKGQLKSVRAKDTAADYVKSGSMQVTLANELFLYRTVHRVKKASESNKSGGSSGRSRSGGGGKF